MGVGGEEYQGSWSLSFPTDEVGIGAEGLSPLMKGLSHSMRTPSLASKPGTAAHTCNPRIAKGV